MIRASEWIWLGARSKMGHHPVGTVAFGPIFQVTASASRIFLLALTVSVTYLFDAVPSRFCTKGD
jgi:hypothetical protein